MPQLPDVGSGAGGVVLDPREHVGQVVEGVNAPRLARRDQRIESGDMRASLGVVDEEEFAPQTGANSSAFGR